MLPGVFVSYEEFLLNNLLEAGLVNFLRRSRCNVRRSPSKNFL